MPELPEVETIVNDLKKTVIGREIERVSGDTDKMAIPGRVREFNRRLKGHKIRRVWRRGKLLVYELVGNCLPACRTGGRGKDTECRNDRSPIKSGMTKKLYLIQHLKLTGQMLLRKASDPREKYVHLTLHLDRGLELRFNDLRKFGKMWLLTPEEFADFGVFKELGAEPLTREFTFAKFYELMQKKKGKVKMVIMDQKNIVGVGNIYAQEALFRAGIHPETLVAKLSRARLRKLYDCMRKVLRDAVRKRGTSESDYLDLYGKEGKYDQCLMVYGRKKGKCLKCGTDLRFIKVGQRGTMYCPKCQRK